MWNHKQVHRGGGRYRYHTYKKIAFPNKQNGRNGSINRMDESLFSLINIILFPNAQVSDPLVLVVE